LIVHAVNTIITNLNVVHGQTQFTRSVGTWNVHVCTANGHW